MSEARLDQIVKGTPPPNVTIPQVAAAAIANPPSPALAAEIQRSTKPVLNPTDPLSTLPSSPPQIYLNLLILEASLRAQYLSLYARRRQHTFFLFLLMAWNVRFTYALFLRPREDGHGHGGSVYWMQDMLEKVAFLGGLLTAMLIWATGTWDRGMRWPRRWVGTTNRGLRVMNLKIVVIRGPWWRQTLAYPAFLLPLSPASSYHYLPTDDEQTPPTTFAYRAQPQSKKPGRAMREEDVAPGGDYIKVLLFPKHFSAEFRENWELFRVEYWERENERRASLRQRVKQRLRVEARSEGGWLWWTGWRGWRRAVGLRVGDVEKVGEGLRRTGGTSRDVARRGKAGTSDSRESSRSSTPALTDDDNRRGHRKTRSTVTSPRLRKRGSSLSTVSSTVADEEGSDAGLGKGQKTETRGVVKKVDDVEGLGVRAVEGPPSGRTRQRDLVISSDEEGD